MASQKVPGCHCEEHPKGYKLHDEAISNHFKQLQIEVSFVAYLPRTVYTPQGGTENSAPGGVLAMTK